ncbi:hypodermin-B-like [Leguminivora glycinivorella]|uniref:hypodermin-B-like n=1 Tax=Leguminivora glycinivorella TaxID=1035111 RepID=UPI00200EE3B9|nr:hypodermin-B-like [Leguminivora glycinivorella]
MVIGDFNAKLGNRIEAENVVEVVCVAWSASQETPGPTRKFDDVQAAEFSRKAYPELGDIPVLNRKVFRGARVEVEEHPYVASIRRLHAHHLVGAILSVHTVVTVAHPLHDVPVTELGVVTGETYCDRGAGYFTVLLALVHQDFDPYTLKADLALLRLYEAIFRMTNQKPIALFKDFHSEPRVKGSHQRKKIAQKAFVTGWGRCDWMGNELCLPRSSLYFPDERQDPMLRTISFNHSYLEESPYCVGYEKHMIKLQSGEGMLCVGPAREAEPLAPCLAAPGALLTVLGSLAGLQSWGFGCGYTHDLPLVYTDLRYYDKWINYNLNILESLETDQVSGLFIATKAYFLHEWLVQTSEQRPAPPRYRDPLQATPLDTLLAELTGSVTDFRDYAYGGKLRQQKVDLYMTIRADSKQKQRLKEISDDIDLYSEVGPLRSFLNRKYYGMIKNSNTTSVNATKSG